ncbi:MAG: HU family DNA-binding protein [Bacteroidales bacterium]|nr:HU family DNA-binding protein [Bacteroidales bacterium]
MNKSELVSAIASDAGISKSDAEKALNACTESIKKALASGDGVQLIGFGTFSISERSARTGRNPQTGKEIQIPAKKVVKFKPGKALDESVQ